MSARWRAGLVGVALLVLGPACEDGVGPVGGVLRVRLSLRTPSTEPDSALLLTVKGPGRLRGAGTPPDLAVFHAGFGVDSTRFVVTGRLVSGADILFVGIEDIGLAAQYTAWVDQVAAPDYTLRPSTSEYQLTVHR